MRIRSTKPEFWRSERIASVSWDARLVLKGLESYVDDNGVGKDDLALIVADVFPRDLSGNPTGTLQRVSEALTHLQNAGLLWRYDHDGTRLLYVAFWESVQRIEKPAQGRFPRPDGTLAYRASTIGASFPEHSGNPTGTLRPGTGEQGNRGTGEQATSLALREEPHQPEKRERQTTTLRIVHGWEQTFPNRPPQKHINDVTAEIQKLVNEGIPPDQIAAGLKAWSDGDSYSPRNIPTHVAKAGRQRQATGTTRAQDILAIDTSSIGGQHT